MRFLIIVLFIVPAWRLSGQDDNENMRPFDLKVAVFPGQTFESSKADIYIWVKNSQLQFVKNDTLFTAHYQINLAIYKNKNVAILTKDTTMTIHEDKYSATLDNEIQHVHRLQYKMKPDEYIFKVRLLDLNSKASREQELKKKVESFDAGAFRLSDVLILDQRDLTLITEKSVIPPMRIQTQDHLYIYAELAHPEDVKEFDILATLSQKGKDKTYKLTKKLQAGPWPSILLLELTRESMNQGINELSLKATAGEHSFERLETLRFIRIFADGEAMSGGSIEEMVEQLTYVARGEEWKKIKNAAEEDKEQSFKEFWQRRDPTPETEQNELFDEYYKRVELSNIKFGSGKRDGWRSDRGRIFIVYGSPDTIERTSPYRNSFVTYEIWYYTELRQKFVFLDEYGFGDFRLVSGNI